jgi:ribosomal protein S18
MLKKQAETPFRLICVRKKTIPIKKNKLKNTDYKAAELLRRRTEPEGLVTSYPTPKPDRRETEPAAQRD